MIASPLRDARRANAAWALAILVGLFAIYHLNGDFLPGNDAKPNVYLALNLLETGDPTFTPSQMPFMFAWELERDGGSVTVYPRSRDERIDGRTLDELRAAGLVSVASEKYYIVPTIREGRYTAMYGPGAGLVALPALGALRWVVGDPTLHPAALWYTAKGIASALVAGSAALLFLTLLAYTSRPRAAILALAYGLGTGVWSTSSQTLWQHGPNVFFLALGTYFLSRLESSRAMGAGCGLTYACAVAIRPDSSFVLAAVGLYLLIAGRRYLVPYVLAAIPPLLVLTAFNAYCFGSPFRFGQTLRGRAEAEAITGAAGTWQTPLLEGLAGHLISPSRGLLVYSPFLVFALWGIVLAWRGESFRKLRPLTVAVAAILVLSSKWYYWWGGWSFGYRLIVDTVWLLTLFVAPALDRIVRRKWLVAVFGVLLAWSVLVQFVGAFAYNLTDWNAPFAGYVVQVRGEAGPRVLPDRESVDRVMRSPGGRIVNVFRLDVNAPEHRHRLWSWRDNQIFHYLRNFSEARRTKREMKKRWLDNPAI